MSDLRTAAATTAIALLAVACGPTRQDEAGSTTATAGTAGTATFAPAQSPSHSPSSSKAGKAAAPAALRFTTRTLDGQTFRGESLAGRPIAFWFWAPWCPKCRAEAPTVKAAAAQHGDVAFVGVAGLDTEAAMKEFV
ncbi:AhpC/TSA family protein [Nonomuraea maritima]|uniref:AhpC/TSA family protein n=1 Tax=Nonomuraea maritima TaxID=683260 RepID=A0A1G8WHF8_9ACTN|nr:redoxin domain-containing protein [Nonomuraea maritima]SDJ77596.1 AhpC/TSA family protein [Nonomuraea maritima]